MQPDPAIWIVHRHPERRAALVRLVNQRIAIATGGPGDPVFHSEAVPEPRAIILGLEDDFELELEFAHRLATRFGARRWILVCEEKDHADARRLFDSLRADILPWPPDPRALSQLLLDSIERESVLPLSARRRRESVSQRFARWFGEAPSATLLGATDPRARGLSLLIRGEAGSGRALLARYLHEHGPDPHTRFVSIPGSAVRSRRELEDALVGDRSAACGTVFLADVDRLPATLQHTLADWIAFEPPAGSGLFCVRWIAGADAEGHRSTRFEARLERLLSSRVVELPALRDQPRTLDHLIASTLAAWGTERGRPAPQLRDDTLEVLRTHPWPGNLAEAESVLLRSLAGCEGETLGPRGLRFESDPVASAGLPLAAEGDEPSSPPSEPPRPEPALASPGESAWAKLVEAANREIRQPLVSIESFAGGPEGAEAGALLSEPDAVGADAERIRDVVTALRNLRALQNPDIVEIDLSALLRHLADACSEVLDERASLFETEIEEGESRAHADASLLEAALAGVLERAVEWLPRGGTLFLASHHMAETNERAAHARILLRFECAPFLGELVGADAIGGGAPRTSAEAEEVFEFVAARSVVDALGGRFTLNAGSGGESLLVIDLPAPPRS